MAWLQHVSIPRPRGAGDVARAFYGKLLNLNELPVPDSLGHLDLTWFDLGEGGVTLELHVFAAEPHEEPTGRHFCLVVDDLDDVRRRLEAAGYEPKETDPIPGRPRFFCRDPFGNRVEFTQITGDYLALQ